MSLKYGRLPRQTRNSRKGPALPRNLRIRIGGTLDLEQLSLELQRMLARLQDYDVHAVRFCSLYLEPLDKSGGRMALRDTDTRPLSILEINRQDQDQLHLR